MKEEQRSRFEQLEHLVEETRGMVEIQVGHKISKKSYFQCDFCGEDNLLLQMRALTDRQLESRASLGDTPLTGVGSFEGNNSLTASRQLGSFEGNNKVGSFEGNNNNLTNGTILDTEEELAEAGSYIRWRSDLSLR